MPKIKVSKEGMEGKPPVGSGIFVFRLDGFKPKFSKKGDSVNLNPTLKVINHPEHNGRPLFENLNTGAGWVQKDLCHALGIPMLADPSDGSYTFPGEFTGPDNDPTQWRYVGPLLGKTGRVDVIEVPKFKGSGTQSSIKSYICAIPGCQEKHTDNLLK